VDSYPRPVENHENQATATVKVQLAQAYGKVAPKHLLQRSTGWTDFLQSAMNGLRFAVLYLVHSKELTIVLSSGIEGER
jgi:hypothetical protein